MKGNKLLAGILSATMVLGTMVMPAFAEASGFEVGSDWAIDFIPKTSSLSVIFSKFPKLNSTEDMTVKLYHDDLLLSTTKAQQKFIENETNNNGTGTSIRVAGMDYTTGEIIDPSSSWGTEINAPWTKTRIPNKIVVNYKGDEITFKDFEYCGKPKWAEFSFAPTSKDLAALIKADTTGEIDLENKVYVIDSQVDIDKDVNLKNGNFDMNAAELDHNAPFWVNGGAEVAFEECNFYGENYSSAYGVVYANDSEVTINDCDFAFTNEVLYDEDEEMGGILKGNDVLKSKINIKDSKFILEDTVRAIAGVTVDMDNVTINATHKSTSTEHFFRDVYGTIKNSTINADNFQNGIKNTEAQSLNLVNSTVELKNMEQNVIYVSDGAKVFADEKSAELFATSDVKKLTPADGYYFDEETSTIKSSQSKIIDTKTASGVTVQLDDLRLNDDIDHTKDATYEVVVSNVSSEDKAVINNQITVADGETVLAYDIKVVKTENGKQETVNVTNQKVTLTLPTAVTDRNNVHLYHIDSTGTKSEITPITVSEDGTKITFTAPSFSAYVVTYNAATVTADEVTENITVAFEQVATKQNEYDIVLKAESGKKINGLTTADLTFALTQGTNGVVSYEIQPAANINLLNPSENRYEFNFDGINAYNATAEKITIGKVVFGGYCTGANFAIATADTNIVHTTKTADSIVDKYTVGGATNALIVSAAINPLTIEEEKKTLTINVDFPNSVNDNAAAYQDMKINISSANSNETIKLGSDINALNGGKYTVTKDLVKNTTYTVTVSGAGYRTARYTVTMTNDKTLNFWNNVKDSAANVEENNTASAKTTTFLAGELVNDGKINIYDLSAVVSYFGTNATDRTTAWDYAKYDLNRDGKIDSRDIAYVLVSWGK